MPTKNDPTQGTQPRNPADEDRRRTGQPSTGQTTQRDDEGRFTDQDDQRDDRDRQNPKRNDMDRKDRR